MKIKQTFETGEPAKITMMCPKCFELVEFDYEKAGLTFGYDANVNVNINPVMLLDRVDIIWNSMCIEHNCVADYNNSHCDQYPYMIQIDNEIAKAVSLFNKKGWYTRYCCSGHEDRPNEIPYIMFDIQHQDVDETGKPVYDNGDALRDTMSITMLKLRNMHDADVIHDEFLKHVVCDFDEHVDGKYLMLTVDSNYYINGMKNAAVACRSLYFWRKLVGQLAVNIEDNNETAKKDSNKEIIIG